MTPEAPPPARGSEGPDRDFSRTRSDLQLWKNGDEDAFARLWERYQPALDLMVTRRIAAIRNAQVRRRIAAEDILHEAVATVLQKLPEFEYRGPGSLFGWMERIAAHKVKDAVDYWEAQRRAPQREVAPRRTGSAATDLVARQPDPRPGPRTRAERDEQHERLRQAVAAMSARDYKVVILRYYLGAEWDQIALEVDAPSGDAVRKQHWRLLPLIATQMAQSPEQASESR